MSFKPGGKPARQPTTDTIIRGIWQRLDALERNRPAAGQTLARADVTVATDSLATNAEIGASFPFGKSFAIFRVMTSQTCRIRIYTHSDDMSRDSSRDASTDPGADIGLILEVITDDTMPTFPVTSDTNYIDYHLSPMVIGANLPRAAAITARHSLEMAADTGIPSTSVGVVENLGAEGVVTMTFTILQFE